MAKKINFGDVFPVLTSQGVAYAQVTHKHSEFGFLIRVFPGFYDKVPYDFSIVTNTKPQFSAFFVVQSAVNQGLLSVVANVPVHEEINSFPVFRARSGGPGGAIWLWDGCQESRLDQALSAVEQGYPTRGVISAPLLVDRIEKGYKAETHEVW